MKLEIKTKPHSFKTGILTNTYFGIKIAVVNDVSGSIFSQLRNVDDNGKIIQTLTVGDKNICEELSKYSTAEILSVIDDFMFVWSHNQPYPFHVEPVLNFHYSKENESCFFTIREFGSPDFLPRFIIAFQNLDVRNFRIFKYEYSISSPQRIQLQYLGSSEIKLNEVFIDFKNLVVPAILEASKVRKINFQRLLLEPENDIVDFKWKMYDFKASKKDANEKLLKDIICMANTRRTDPAYIIFGVKIDRRSGEKQYSNIEIHPDDADLQDKLLDKLSERVKFTYSIIEYAGNSFGLIEIPVIKYDNPIYALKNYQGIEKGKIYYRQSSVNALADNTEEQKIREWLNNLPEDFRITL